MKKLLIALAAATLLAGCAGSKKDVPFVPIQISWQSVGDVDTSEPYVSGCMIRVTNALMGEATVQKYADANLSYVAVITARTVGDGLNLDFLGACPADALVAPEVCSWSAVCDAKGEIVDLKMGLK